MNALNKFLSKVEAHIDAGFDLHDAMADFVPHFNRMTGEQQFDVRDALVLLVANKKGIPTQVTKMGARKGRPTFERGSAGLSMVNYYMPKVEKPIVEKSSTTRKSVDPVAEAVKAYEKLLGGLTPAQQKAFKKAVA
jgi:hypothetical protein